MRAIFFRLVLVSAMSAVTSEGWRREVSPYPDPCPIPDLA
jgi:hypothetical protein